MALDDRQEARIKNEASHIHRYTASPLLRELGYPATADGWAKLKRDYHKVGRWGRYYRAYCLLRKSRKKGVDHHDVRQATAMVLVPLEGELYMPPKPQNNGQVTEPKAPKRKSKKKREVVSDSESLRWALSNVHNFDNLTESDAPSPMAWALIKSCHEDPKIQQDSWRQWTTITAKKEDAQISDKDVRHEKQMMARLLEFEEAG